MLKSNVDIAEEKDNSPVTIAKVLDASPVLLAAEEADSYKQQDAPIVMEPVEPPAHAATAPADNRKIRFKTQLTTLNNENIMNKS
jgi:hypothetical protein